MVKSFIDTVIDVVKPLRDIFEDVGIGVFMTVQVFRGFDKGLITIVLGAVYLGYKIYREYLRALNEKAKNENEKLQKEMLTKQLEAWVDTTEKIDDNLKRQANAKIKHKKSQKT